MELRKIAGCSGKNDCPNVYLTDRGTIAVQGMTVTTEMGRHIPENESIVEIPIELLESAAAAIDTSDLELIREGRASGPSVPLEEFRRQLNE